MKVNEIFYSIDGEGRRTGELTTFIRLYGCPLKCSYCDTRYSCEKTDENIPYTEMAIEDIINEVNKYPTKNITVTGGEPLIQKDIKYLLRALSELDYDVNVETSGAIDISEYFELGEDNINHQLNEYKNVWFTVDYKCPTSGMDSKMFMDNFKQKFFGTVYKFVVGSKGDLATAFTVINNNLINRSYIPVDLKEINNLIYLSPVFGQIEPKEIVEYMQEKKMVNSSVPIRVQLQLHKFIWKPDKRGV